jgi:hypothetical protein
MSRGATEEQRAIHKARLPRARAGASPARVRAVASVAGVQGLEPRTLLSGTWQTVFDNHAWSDYGSIASDAAGNVYAAATIFEVADGVGITHIVIEEKLAGGDAWTTISDTPNAACQSMVVNSAGDIYVADFLSMKIWKMKRSAGESTFSLAWSVPQGGYIHLRTVDASDDIYAVGVTYPTSGGNVTYVLRQSAGEDDFAVIDSSTTNHVSGFAPMDVVVVPTGASAGIYVAGGYQPNPGDSGSGMVRRSTDGGSTWTTVNLGYRYDVRRVTADPLGNLYVVGTADNPPEPFQDLWVVKKSTDAGRTWSVVDSFNSGEAIQPTIAGIAADQAGNIYVAGIIPPSEGTAPPHALIRSNIGGTWHTVDDYQGGWGWGLAIDSRGQPYAALTAFETAIGHQRLIVRSPGASSAVVGRHVFYDRSAFDAGDDDAAVATDKAALRPGQTATFANVTSYSRGINGVMVDVTGLPAGAALTADDFSFRWGRSADGSDFADGPAPASVTVRPAEGSGGGDRVTLVWGDDAVRNGWLEVTVRANADTGLAAPDVFGFGNLVGDTGNSATSLTVNAQDLAAVRRHLFSPSAVTGRFDFDRDGRVTAADFSIVRANYLARLQPLTAMPPTPVSERRRDGEMGRVAAALLM